MRTDYQTVVMQAGTCTCPTCGADLENLIEMETADLVGERCPENREHLDNTWVNDAAWPEIKPRRHPLTNRLTGEVYNHVTETWN